MLTILIIRIILANKGYFIIKMSKIDAFFRKCIQNTEYETEEYKTYSILLPNFSLIDTTVWLKVKIDC